MWGPREIDLFASDHNHRLPAFYSGYWNVHTWIFKRSISIGKVLIALMIGSLSLLIIEITSERTYVYDVLQR